MRAYYDLHIHSALSPCGDEDMTPNNVVNMAKLIGLDVIALTDHNAADNLPAFSRVCDEAGIIFIPGIELNTEEEVHLLAYFLNVGDAVDFGRFVYDSLPDIPNNEKFFGRQVVLNEKDHETGVKEKLLISALPFSFDECLSLISDAGGAAVPAHVNKSGNSVINNLGFLPESDHFNTIEVSENIPYADDGKYRILRSSDAHYLENMAEKESFMDISGKNAEFVIEYIKNKI